MRLCVFCGSSDGARPLYREAATALGRHFGEAGIELVYGGGKVGLMGDMGLLWSLPQRIGTAETRRLLFTSAIIDAEAALGLGLVDRCVPAESLLAEARALAGELAQAPPVAIAATKAVLARGPAPLDQILATELDHQTLLFSTDDFVEGRAAFKERRPARFTGR